MTPYSQDLRQRILDTVQRGEGSLRQIARRFLVSVSFVTRLLRTPPQHRFARAQAPWRRQPGRPQIAGPRAAPRADPTAARCHPRGVPPAARRLVQPHDDLARPEPAGAAAQEEGPARPGAGPSGRPGATAGVLRAARQGRPATAGLRGRVRGQHGDDPDARPCARWGSASTRTPPATGSRSR